MREKLAFLSIIVVTFLVGGGVLVWGARHWPEDIALPSTTAKESKLEHDQKALWDTLLLECKSRQDERVKEMQSRARLDDAFMERFNRIERRLDELEGRKGASR